MGTGIRVNVLSPGATATPGLLNGLARTSKKSTRQYFGYFSDGNSDPRGKYVWLVMDAILASGAAVVRRVLASVAEKSK